MAEPETQGQNGQPNVGFPKDKKEQVEPPCRDAEELSEDGSGERPIRQKLKETSINSLSRQPSPEDKSPPAQEPASADNEERGRVRRKRSFDESKEEDNADAETEKKDENSQRRKRSRDSKVEEKQSLPEPKENRARTPSREVPRDETGQVLSPKKKRSRDQLDKDTQTHTETRGQPSDKADAEKPTLSTNNRTEEGEPEKKRHRDDSKERDALKNEKAHASKATKSSSKDEPPKSQPMTSSSAFASSGLAAFASSEKSPFGIIGGDTSVFKTLKPTEVSAGEKKEAASTSAASPSPFTGTGASPFGSLPGGFAASAFASFASAAPKPAGGLTSFASQTGGSNFGAGSKSKAFGSASDDEAENEQEAVDEARPAFEGLEEVKEDERFFKQDIETGEEGETTLYSCRGKLFQFDGKEWKERGIGTFKINAVESPADTEGGAGGKKTVQSARMIMRTDAVLRVVLNSPIFKGMKVGDVSGNEPAGKQINLVGIENGKTTPFLLRTASVTAAKDAYHSIQSILSEL
ncbi:predicted protein [Uncinocarpus reesii 1704]|uniref:RanBD1 domain-containing protein n=1 Tax=Uncinocarpus reesii (strain UAMH 1704) TaxID=336963 RepID=C4JHA7_UNCRE|nr:uncharacterized protein UREG_02680 [Uncinocarpus reesii 1704]EEP77831.1 predicted protein [Uncinocarpus reesii 1704]